MWLLTLQLFKNSIDTKQKLRLNLHSLSVSAGVSELLEYGRASYTRKYMHAETLALLTKPLYFPNMKYLEQLTW
jgi:hypothetical protein